MTGYDRAELRSRMIAGVALYIISVAGAVIGAGIALRSLSVATWLSGRTWQVARYQDWDLQFYDAFVAMLCGAIVVARLSQVGNGLLGRLLGYRTLFGRPHWWDLLLLGVPMAVWAYLIRLANFD